MPLVSKLKITFLVVVFSSFFVLFLYSKSNELSDVWKTKVFSWSEAGLRNQAQMKKAFQRILMELVNASNAESELNAEAVETNSKNEGKKTIEVQLKEALERAQKKKYHIIIWNPLETRKVDPRSLIVSARSCGNCSISYDRMKLNDTATKAVVFSYHDLKASSLPAHRNDQLFVWWTMEAPPALLYFRGLTLAEFDGLFNLTMTHRRDSDVYFGYTRTGSLWKEFRKSSSGDVEKDISDTISNKRKLALWVVSNCEHTIGAKKRMAYTDQLLAAGLSLDRFGGCFPERGRISTMEIAKMYMFYFAFENSLGCKDYITEKVFNNALKMGTVPVVMGAPKSDYEATVPPGSCIYVEDFKSPADLVKYLNYLYKNITAYKEYFKWRTMSFEDMPQHNRTKGLCNLCRILHGINVDDIYKPKHITNQENIPLFGYPSHPRIVSSLQRWFYTTENKECLAKQQY